MKKELCYLYLYSLKNILQLPGLFWSCSLLMINVFNYVMSRGGGEKGTLLLVFVLIEEYFTKIKLFSV